ncbi:lipoprotein [Amycolatopsis sp. H20-H5]|uniref:lipoprotein n=1 Tax=Amycolatopsis sp. H20-H5 TaxID=3046309 RepID=UPI002DBA3EFD|nr:lipoprotein [Amycolatopsis sp. H20-H5]MEC3973783.1 lipoprotein [Amycolatopsis sp. H20-H5]
MRSVITAAAAAALFVLAGCGSADQAASTTDAPKPGAQAPAGDEVGAAGSACPMPVTFKVAAKWKPQASTSGTKLGGAELLCEIDAKPAGSIGYVRVLLAKGVTDPMAALGAYTAVGKNSGFAYTDVQAGAVAAKEVTYTAKSMDVDLPNQVLAVPVGGNVALVTISSIDADLFKEIQPAFELAKSSLKLTA